MAIIPSEPAAQSDSGAPVEPVPGFIRLRVWLIGLILIPLLVFWVEYTETVAQGPDLAAMSLPMSSMFALMAMLGPNIIIRRFWPKQALSQAELLTILGMNTIGVYISGIGMMQFLHPVLVGWYYYQTPQNGWNTWIPLIRKWAVPDPSVIDDYYVGKSSFFTPEHIAGWLQPMLFWSAFILVLLSCTYCIGVLMRRQWVDNERLIFPIVQIPLEITRDGGATPMWRSRLLWIGIAIPVIFESIAAAHYTVAPSMPYFPIKPEASLEVGHYFTRPPWSAMGYTTFAFYPLVIGLTYLLSLDVSFSCWFFYLGAKIENVACTALGFRDPGAGPVMASMPYLTEQSVGAYIGLALYSIYLARKHFAAIWQTVVRGTKAGGLDDSNEPMSYRAALLGLVVTSALLVAAGVALGLSMIVSLLFFVLFLLMALTFSRIRAEAGLPWGQGPYGLTHGTLVNIGGSESFSRQELVTLTLMTWFDNDWRCLVQPAQLEAMKMVGDSNPRRIHPRQLTLALMAATILGVAAAWICSLAIYYHYGAASAKVNPWRTDIGRYPFEQLQQWLNVPKLPSSPRLTAACIGLGITGMLGAMRMRFVWWPLHPIGYALSGTDTMTWIWFAMFLGWLAKSCLLRFGGVKTYRTALPFFIGLVLGDYAISGILSLIFLYSGHAGYRTFPI